MSCRGSSHGCPVSNFPVRQGTGIRGCRGGCNRRCSRRVLCEIWFSRTSQSPVPNYLCYPEAFKLYDPKTGRWHGGRLPKCRVCECTLQPTENHLCEASNPKYVKHDQPSHDRR